jgi:hypothetical protein
MDRMDRRKTFFIGLFLTTICHCLTGIAGMLLPVEPRASVRDRGAGDPVRAGDAVLPQHRGVGVAGGDLPLEIRGLAIGIAVFFGWFVNGLLALYVPTLLNALGLGTFFLFAVIGVIMLGFLWHEVRDRGRSLIAGRGSPGRRDLQDAAPTRSFARSAR